MARARIFGVVFSYALLAILILVVYFPALRGIFLLDDVPNLKTLERITEPASFSSLVNVALTGVSGAFGRCLPMFTFALQHQSWPQDPAAFKFVNLLIHLANTLLVAILAHKVAAVAGLKSSRAAAVSLMTAAIWSLHPLQVSSVMYVIQRMTEMSAFFIFFALISYVNARTHLHAGRHRLGWAWLAASLVAMGLSLLCKEIGVLAPLYALMLELTVLPKLNTSWERWKYPMLLALPVLASAYLAWIFPHQIEPTYALRDFTMTERLLTEGRVLLGYLRQILLPDPSALGLFHDDYLVSRGWFSPPTTLAAWLGIAGLSWVAWICRRRVPGLTLAIGWFFVGHLLESSVLPLELYFEHRNYVPMAGIWLGLALACLQSARFHRIWLAGGLLWVGLLAWLTWNESKLWGNPYRQAAVWAHRHPDSIRATLQMAGAWLALNMDALAVAEYQRLARRPSAQASAYAEWLAATCGRPHLVRPGLDTAYTAIRQASFSHAPIHSLEKIVIAYENGACSNLEPQSPLKLFAALLHNPAYSSRQFELWVLQGRLLMATGAADAAFESFGQARSRREDIEVVLLQVKALVLAGRPQEVPHYIRLAQRINDTQSNFLLRAAYARDIRYWIETTNALYPNTIVDNFSAP
ncbi:MAG: hypothetical protein N2Z69_09115 [Methylophilaceae bacterium]|nr:hypothetical protein [Methylophilaceae bacterium]